MDSKNKNNETRLIKKKISKRFDTSLPSNSMTLYLQLSKPLLEMFLNVDHI